MIQRSKTERTIGSRNGEEFDSLIEAMISKAMGANKSDLGYQITIMFAHRPSHPFSSVGL
jgi:hypothetical protein